MGVALVQARSKCMRLDLLRNYCRSYLGPRIISGQGLFNGLVPLPPTAISSVRVQDALQEATENISTCPRVSS